LLDEYSVGYNGEVSGKAYKLSWAQVRAALPEASQCGSVELLSLMTGRARRFLLEPELSLKDLSQYDRPSLVYLGPTPP
jgi:hypothetical protein